MARTARLALEVDARQAKRQLSEADRELKNVKATASATDRELRRLAKGSDDVGRGASRGAKGMRELRTATEGANRSFLRARVSASGLSSSFVALRNAAAVLIAVQIGRYFLSVTDRAKRMEAGLRLTIPATMSMASAYKEIGRIASETRAGLEPTAELYGKIARTAADMGKSSESAGRATESVAKALKISGADAGTTAGVIRQLGQALASGVLRGDEFNTIMEGSPRLAKLMADSLNVSTGALRGMAEQGQLTSDALYKALTDRKFTEQLDKEFREMPVTFEDAMTALHNSAFVTISAFDAGGEFSRMFIDWVTGGVNGFADMAESAEETGMRIRSMIDGLSGAWAPFFSEFSFGVEGMTGFFDHFIENTLKDIDNITGGIAGAMNWLSGYKGPQGSGTDLAGRYVKDRNESMAKLEKDQALRKVNLNAPSGIRYVYNPDGFSLREEKTSAATRTTITNKPLVPKTPKGSIGANAEIGREWTTAQVRSVFEREGVRVTGGDRDAAGQQRQLDIWAAKERARPGSGGIKPAPVGASAHQRGSAIDINDRTPISRIKDIAKKYGIPIAKLKDEEDHKHLEFGSGGRGGKSEAEKALEREEKLRERRKEMEADFWDDLKANADTAGMLPDELEKYNALAKLSAALNHENKGVQVAITDEMVKQIDLEIQRRKDGEFIQANKQQQLDQEQQLRQLTAEGAVLANSTLETQDENLRVLAAGQKVLEEALKAGKDLTSQTVVVAVAEAEARERSLAAQGKINAEIRRGNELTQEMLDQANPGEARSRQFEKEVAAIESGGYSRADKDEAIRQLTENFVENMNAARMELFDKIGSNIDQVASGLKEAFGDAFGSAVGHAMSIANIFAALAAGMSGAELGARSSGGIAQALSGLSGIAGTISKTFGANSALGKTLGGLSKGLGQAAGGAAMGAEIAGLAKAIGFKKFSTTGAQIGGAIGSFIPIPGGQIIGSVIGGVVGSLFKKTKYGRATISSVEGDADLGGNSGKMKKAAGVAASSIQDGLRSIAEQLGAGLGSFGAISIGQRHGDWRVNTGGTSLKKKKGAKEFDDDQEGAIRYAISVAIQRGALTGLSPTIMRIMKNAGEEFEKGLDDAMTLTNAFRELRMRKDPVNASLEDLNKQFGHLKKLLDDNQGAASEYAQIEELYQMKRLEIIEQGNNAALQSMKDYLNELKGGTSSVLSPQLRYLNSRTEFNRLEDLRASGGDVDFGQYQTAADNFLAASRDYQGSDMGFMSDLARVTGALESWIGTTAGSTTGPTITIPPIDFGPVVNALNQQTGYLQQIANGVGGGGGGGLSGGGPMPGGTSGGSSSGGGSYSDNYNSGYYDRYVSNV